MLHSVFQPWQGGMPMKYGQYDCLGKTYIMITPVGMLLCMGEVYKALSLLEERATGASACCWREKEHLQ